MTQRKKESEDLSELRPKQLVSTHIGSVCQQYCLFARVAQGLKTKRAMGSYKETRQVSIRLHECVVLESNVNAGGEEKLENVRQRAAASQNIAS